MTAAPTDSYVFDRLPAAQDMPTVLLDRPEQQWPEHLNVVDWLFTRANENGHTHRPLLRSDELTLSYGEAQVQVNAISHWLVHTHGLVPGNRVLLRGGNSVAMALCWLAVVRCGAIAVATMPLLRAKELVSILDKAKPRLALCDARLTDELDQAIAQHGQPLSVVAFHSSADDGLEAVLARATPGPDAPAHRSAATDIAMMAFTSGTTGAPKAALHSHRDIAAACEAWPRHVLRATPDDVVVGSPPLAFTFGLGGLLVFPMWAGASVYFPAAPYTPESLVRTIGRVGATICYTAPTFYRQMAPFARDLGVGSLHTTVSAGEGLPDATRQLWKEASGIEMLDGIGATEMFHIFISSPPESVRRGAIGQVVPGYEAHIVDDQGNPLPRGTVGRLAVRGPTGCKYLDDERQARYVQNGWNFPGDAFMQDEDGYFFYQARTDDMIITAGYNVAGPEVEASLLLHQAVAECGVVGRPDDERGMVVVAYVVLKPGYEPNADTTRLLQDHVKTDLAPYKYPRDVRYVNQLPRTETGKLQRFALRQLAQSAA
jgi:2-aminobenzoate-CoA ligase